jgi:hypothetical protein
VQAERADDLTESGGLVLEEFGGGLPEERGVLPGHQIWMQGRIEANGADQVIR